MLPGMDGCQIALRASVESLSPKQKFNLIVLTHGDQLEMLSKEPIAATPENVKKCIELINKITPRGDSNTEKALRAALQQHPAAIYLVAASAVETTKAKSLAVVKNLNANRRIQINTFAWGEDNPDNESLMRALADASGGAYRLVTNHERQTGISESPLQPTTAPAGKAAPNKPR
jgi:hypothetical protein